MGKSLSASTADQALIEVGGKSGPKRKANWRWYFGTRVAVHTQGEFENA